MEDIIKKKRKYIKKSTLPKGIIIKYGLFKVIFN